MQRQHLRKLATGFAVLFAWGGAAAWVLTGHGKLPLDFDPLQQHRQNFLTYRLPSMLICARQNHLRRLPPMRFCEKPRRMLARGRRLAAVRFRIRETNSRLGTKPGQ